MKKILFLFLISFAFLSCSNNNQTSDISFSFSRNILSENQDTTNESDLNISCKIEGSSINQVKSYKIKSSQKEASFTFEELPVDTTVTVEVNVLDLDKTRLYTGKTSVTVKQGDNPLSIDLKKVEDGANLSIDGINGINFAFDNIESSEDGSTSSEIPRFTTSQLIDKKVSATTTILTESEITDEIKSNLTYSYYLNGEKLEREENSEKIIIYPTDPLETEINKLLVIVQYDNSSDSVYYYSALLKFVIKEEGQA